MRMGVNVPNFGPGTGPDVLRDWAQTVEGLGYGLLMVSDHVAVTADVSARYPAPFYEAFATLAWLAGSTRRVHLGTTVLVLPYRNPLLTARMAASLDRLSGGRFILGVGAGWSRQEFAALGLPFERRGAMTDDYLRAIRALWTEDVAGHQGPFTSFAGIHTAPRPARAGQPPIWVGGNSDAGIRRAVRLGDAWHPLRFTMPWLRAALVRLKSAADAAGRDVPGLAPRIALRLTDAPVVDDGRLAGVGTIAQVRGDIEELRTLGAAAIVFDPYAGDPEETRRPEVAWRALAAVAAELTDLVGRDPTETERETRVV